MAVIITRQGYALAMQDAYAHASREIVQRMTLPVLLAHALKEAELKSISAAADGSFSSYYGRFSGTGLNTSFVQDDDAGYAALQCSQALNSYRHHPPV